VGLRLIFIPPNETTLRMICPRLFVGDRPGRIRQSQEYHWR
jgi:hypothetical protein